MERIDYTDSDAVLCIKFVAGARSLMGGNNSPLTVMGQHIWMCSVGAGSIPIELSFVCCEFDVDGKDDIAPYRRGD